MPKFIPFILAGLMPLSTLQGKTPAPAPIPAPPIHQVVLEKLQDDGILDVRIVVGFLDGPAEETDGKHTVYNKWAMRELWHKLRAMGFDATHADPVDFGVDSKERLDGSVLFSAQAPARSGEGVVRVTVMNSSLLTTVEEFGQDAEKSEQQLVNSARARRFMVEAVKKADVFVYIGHSREGGWADTFPPMYKADGHVDYDKYRQLQRGVKDLENAVKDRKGAPPVFASFSCLSDCHFGKRAESWGKDTKQPFYFLGSEELVYMDEDAGAATALIGGLMDFENPGDIEKRINREKLAHPNVKDVRRDAIFRFKPIRGR